MWQTNHNSLILIIKIEEWFFIYFCDKNKRKDFSFVWKSLKTLISIVPNFIFEMMFVLGLVTVCSPLFTSNVSSLAQRVEFGLIHANVAKFHSWVQRHNPYSCSLVVYCVKRVGYFWHNIPLLLCWVLHIYMYGSFCKIVI